MTHSQSTRAPSQPFPFNASGNIFTVLACNLFKRSSIKGITLLVAALYFTPHMLGRYYRDMAKMLPDTPAKLKEIDQMTDVRVEKFGHVIFAVCKVR